MDTTNRSAIQTSSPSSNAITLSGADTFYHLDVLLLWRLTLHFSVVFIPIDAHVLKIGEIDYFCIKNADFRSDFEPIIGHQPHVFITLSALLLE